MECKTSSGSYPDTNTTENQESKVPQESGGDLHTEYYIYREDVVKSNNDESMLGVVTEVPGDSDSDSSSSYDSDTFYGGNSAIDSNDSTPTNKSSDKNDCLAAGQAKIMWIDGTETTSGLDDISLINRGFLHGDIISSVTDPTGQLGLVLDVHITVDLLSPTGELVTNVSSRDLKRFREFTVGDYVVCGSWLGRVDDMVENVIVLFDDGSVCKVMKADTSRLKPISKSIASDGVFPYYPGQRVRAASSSVFKGSRWLSGLWKANRLEGTVTKVQAGTLFVYWIASSNPGEGSARGMVPSEEQNPKDLTLLSCFSHVNWQLGEWCLFYGATTAKEIGNSTNGCTSDNNRLNKDIGCESENVKEVQSSLESHHIENDHILNSSPTESIYGIVNNDQCRASDNAYEASDIDETSKLECINAALEPQSCSGMSSCLKDSSREGFPAYRKKIRKVFFKREKKGHKRDEEHAKAFIIANITTKVDVVWQDGTRKFQMDSKLLVPFNNPGDQDFFPEQYIIEKALNENENTLNENECCAVKRVGVVKSVDAKERIACVRWLKHVSKPEDIREFDKEEMVSVYELDMHPDYDYCYGDVVVRLSPASIPPSSATSETHIQEQDDHMTPVQKGNEISTNKLCHDVENISNGGSNVDLSSLSWVGHITGLKDGDIEVTWGDGMVSKVGPQAIYVVGREGDDESLDGGSEYSDGGSWETVEENEMAALNAFEVADPQAKYDVGREGDDESLNGSSEYNDGVCWETVKENQMATLDASEVESVLPHPVDSNVMEVKNSENHHLEDEGLEQNGPLSSAINFVTSLASGFFSQGRKEILSMDSEKSDLNESEVKEHPAPSVKESAASQSSFKESNILDSHAVHSAYVPTNASSTMPVDADSEVTNSSSHSPDEKSVNSSSAGVVGGISTFKHFDIAGNPLDHYYYFENEQNTGGKKWAKKVQQEWNILEKNLPDEVYVRVFEDRMELLRAVIVGACGTPYQDGLFFFDFHLLQDYPRVPPSVYYHSGGLRVNPNLYESGKVCLSLLNTWTGKGNEVWDSSSSSILQVLVSIQGLVLNSKPYFNEAGYEKQIGTVEGEKNYLPYNENTFLLNLKTMMYLLRKPRPMHFEEFVVNHFRRKGHNILKACDSYMKGCVVGSLTKDACSTDISNENSCSVGFKLILKKIVPKLFKELKEVGADCQQFEHFLQF